MAKSPRHTPCFEGASDSGGHSGTVETSLEQQRRGRGGSCFCFSLIEQHAALLGVMSWHFNYGLLANNFSGCADPVELFAFSEIT